MARYCLNLRDYWRILWKRKLIFILTTLIILFISFSFATFKKPIPLYSASSSIKIEQGITLTGLYREALSWSEANTIDTYAAIIRSYYIIERVAKTLGFVDKSLTSDEIRGNSAYLNIVLNLKDKITVEREGATNIIVITATSEEPGLTQKLADTVAEVYIEENIKERNRRIREARLFIERQLEIIGKRLKTAEEDVAAFREKNKLTFIDDEIKVTINKLSMSETKYEDLRRTIKEIYHILKRLDKELVIQNNDIRGIFADNVSPIFARLNSTVVDLNLKKEALLMEFTGDHPIVTEIEANIKEIVRKMIAELSAQLETLKRRRVTLRRDIGRLRKKFATLPEKGLILSRLEHEVAINAHIFSLLESKYQEAMIKEAEKVNEVMIIRPALKPTKPVNTPKVYRVLFIGAVAGLILGLILVFIFENLDTSVKTIDEAEKLLEVPVVGVIPHVGFSEIKDILLKKYPGCKDKNILLRNARLITHFAPKSLPAESYRILRTNIQHISMEEGVKTVLFAGSSPLEEKPTTIVNLAIAAAQTGKRILLVESNLRKPLISEIFGIDREPGLTDIVLGNYEWQDTKRTVADIMTGRMGMEDIMLTPGIDNLNIITCGTMPPNPSEILSSQRMTDLISQVREEYDIILFDSTPILTAADASILGSKLDAVIMICQVGKISREALTRAKAQLCNVSAKVLGVVLDGLKADTSPDYAEIRYARYYEEEAPSGLAKWLPLFGPFMRWLNKGSERTIWEEKGMSRWHKIVISVLALSILIGGSIWQITLWRHEHPGRSLKDKTEAFVDEEKDVRSVIRKRVERDENLEAVEDVQKQKIDVEDSETTKVEMPLGKESPVSEEPVKSWVLAEISGKYPYTVQVSAYRDRDLALTEVDSLRSKGVNAYSTLVFLGTKGKWYRVEIGAFKSKDTAEKFAAELKSSMGFSWVRVTKRPYTIEIGHFDSENDLKRMEAELIAKGYSPYVFIDILDRDHSEWKLLIGAFHNKEQAMCTSEELKKDGIENEISER